MADNFILKQQHFFNIKNYHVRWLRKQEKNQRGSLYITFIRGIYIVLQLFYFIIEIIQQI